MHGPRKDLTGLHRKGQGVRTYRVDLRRHKNG
jgi:hypothetical protein